MSWWLTALRGAVALALGIAVVVASLGESFLATSLAFYFVLGGLAALQSVADEPAPGRARLRRGGGIVKIALAAGILGRSSSCS